MNEVATFNIVGPNDIIHSTLTNPTMSLGFYRPEIMATSLMTGIKCPVTYKTFN